MKTVLMIGQFPLPITGEAASNVLVKDFLSKYYIVCHVNSSLVNSVQSVGNFSLHKLLRLIVIYFKIFVKSFSADIVYITPGQTKFGILRSFLIILYLRMVGKKVISHWHGYGALAMSGLFLRLCSFSLVLSSVNIFLTYDFLNKVKIFFNLKGDNFTVVQNFCDESEIGNLLPSDRLKVVFLGSLMREKGIVEFLEAASLYVMADFYVCGTGSEEMINLCTRSASERNNIHYLGVVTGEAKAKILKDMDIFVLQSSYVTEGVPLAMLESMAAGCGVLATKHNGIPEIVGDLPFWLDYSSASSLVNGIRFYDIDRDRLLSEKKRMYDLSKNFTVDKFRNKILEVFERVTK